MPSQNAPPPRGRTVEEAVAQANAKERIRTAQGVRAAGGPCLVFGLAALARAISRSRISQAFGMHNYGSRPFSVSVFAIVGILAIIVGPILFAGGHLMLKRAKAAAAGDPVTASILAQFDL